MEHSMPGLPVHHQPPEFTQTLLHWVGDTIQPSHPLSSPSPPAFNLSQHQGLFKWVSSSHQVARVLEFQLQHLSFQWTLRTDLFFFIWRLITLQYCSGFCHTLTWISHGLTCAPHPVPPSHLPPHPIPLGHPSPPALSTCLMHPTWTGDLFHTW